MFGIGGNSAVAKARAQDVQRVDQTFVWLRGSGYVAICTATDLPARADWLADPTPRGGRREIPPQVVNHARRVCGGLEGGRVSAIHIPSMTTPLLESIAPSQPRVEVRPT